MEEVLIPSLLFRFRADGAPAKNPFAKRGTVPGPQRGRGRGPPGGVSSRGVGQQMEQTQQQQVGIPSGISGRTLPGAGMLPPPPPPPDIFQQTVTGGVPAEFYGHPHHAVQPPMGHHPSMPPHPGLPPHHPHSLYMTDPQYQVAAAAISGIGQPPAVGPVGLRRRPPTRPPHPDLLLQDELSLQYGGTDVATAAAIGKGKLSPHGGRYDLLGVDILGATGNPAVDFDAYRAMELGLPLTDEFGVPLYDPVDLDLMNDPTTGASLMPAGFEHQDVLLYERQGAQIGSGCL